MKLHSNILTDNDVFAALQRAKDAGKVDTSVMFEEIQGKGSRSHKQAWEVKLGWYGDKVKGDGRRWTNSGTRGNGGNYAATYDEWGWFIAELYAKDENAVFGQYKGYDDFMNQTRFAYDV